MNQTTLYDRTYRAVEEAIVRKLRQAARPIPAEDLARMCHVSRLCAPDQLRESLDRLEQTGRIRRVSTSTPHSALPLFAGATVDAYVAIDRGHDAP